MRTKTRIKLLVLLIVCMTTALIAGCSIGGDTLDGYLESNGATGQCVTYYGNGGTFNGNSTKTQVDVYYKPDAYIICTEQEKFKVERKSFTFDGWYYGEEDGEGKPVIDNDGNLKLTAKKLEEKTKIPAGEHYYVGAKWNANVAIDTYLVTDGFSVKSGDTVYNSGDLIKTANFGSSSKFDLSESQNAIKATDASWLWFYEDEECTKPISTVNKPEEEGAENVKVYAKYLQGNWTVVSTARKVKDMFNGSGNGGNYYLFTPDGTNVIDYTDTAIGLNSYLFNINIAGNGVKIKNLKFSSSALSGTYSTFGKFTAEAKIKDLILEDVTVSATTKTESELYLICHGDEGADISGFKIENISFNVKGDVFNMENNRTDNWLFGGFANDGQYISSDSCGITVNKASLTLNEEILVSNFSTNQEE